MDFNEKKQAWKCGKFNASLWIELWLHREKMSNHIQFFAEKNGTCPAILAIVGVGGGFYLTWIMN